MAYHYNPQNAAYNFEWQLSDFPVGTEAWEVDASRNHGSLTASDGSAVADNVPAPFQQQLLWDPCGGAAPAAFDLPSTRGADWPTPSQGWGESSNAQAFSQPLEMPYLLSTYDQPLPQLDIVHAASGSQSLPPLNLLPYDPLQVPPPPIVVPSQRRPNPSPTVSPTVFESDSQWSTDWAMDWPTRSPTESPPTEPESETEPEATPKRRRAHSKSDTLTPMACLFCRGRHIKCGGPAEDSASCSQCLSRSLECIFPEQSYRGRRTDRYGKARKARKAKAMASSLSL